MVYRKVITIASTALISLCVGISACSVKTLYNNLDYLIPEYVAGMITLDDALENKVEQRSRALIHWHRKTQLTQYADWLKKVQQQVGPQLTEQQVKFHINEINRYYRDFIIQLNQEMAELLPLLNEQQQNEMFSHIAHKNKEFREKYVGLDETKRIEAYIENLQDSYEAWLGDLSAEQEKTIVDVAKQMQSTAELRLWRRLEWQKGIKEILSSQHSPAIKSEHLITFMSGFVNIDNDATRETSEINNKLIASLTAQIAHGMSSKQKDHFLTKTSDYIRMLTELAANS